MREYEIHQVDAFTQNIFEGNPAGVVTHADTLSVPEMQKIAHEMNLSETVFEVSSSLADIRLRYFTPTGDEITFCGHATIAYLSILHKKSPSLKKLQIETKAGVIEAEIDKNEATYRITAPKIQLAPTKFSTEDIVNGLGIDHQLINHENPVMIEKTNNYLYFMVNSLEDLKKLTIDQRAAIDFAKQNGIILYCALTNTKLMPGYDVYCRGFAPQVGVAEDPVCGSLQGGLTAYLLEQSLISKNTKQFRSGMGLFLGRPGEIKVHILDTKPPKIQLEAHAAHVFSSTLQIHEEHLNNYAHM
ncbi:MAG: isomerase [Waddliaceae bacterium]|nr:isomerase [Waddliaceae bacterium]